MSVSRPNSISPMPGPDGRLERLRAHLREHGVDGFLLPRGDEHLGEYVPACAERLAWLTGFTGSAGFAVVLPDEARVFSDGRYQVQMGQQLDPTVWSTAHRYETPGPTWLAHHAAGRAIGYDPRTISETELAAYVQAGCRMVALACNPIDAIWPDRPAAPDTTVESLPVTYTGTDSRTRTALVTAILDRDSQDSAILPDPTDIAWMLNIRARDLEFLPVPLSFAIISRSGSVQWFIEPSRVPAHVADILGPDVDIRPPSELEAGLGALTGQTVRLDPARSAAWFWQCLRDAGANPIAGTDPCLEPRARKTETERAGMRHAHHLDGIALCRFLFWLERNGIGRTETEVADHLLSLRLASEACTGPSFATIAAAGPNAAIMHYAPRRTDCATLESGTFFLIDSGGQYRCGTTDVTRTIWLGDGAPPAAWRDHYTRVLKGLIGLSRAIFPKGTHGYRLDPLARLPLWDAHLDFDHGAGHGLGSYLSVHEWPLGFTRRPVLDAIEEHMILTNEPGYYAPGSHGIRLENAMEVRRHDPDGRFLNFETLTLAPIDRRGIEPSLLSPEERAWLDAFHAHVEALIAPSLPPAERDWLIRACAPL